MCLPCTLLDGWSYGSGNNLPMYQLQWNQALNPHSGVFWSITFPVDIFSLTKPCLKAQISLLSVWGGQPIARTGLGWAKKVPETASHLHGIPSAGRVGTALYKQRGNSASLVARKSGWHQVRSSLFLRPANHLGETEGEGGHQDLGGKGRGGNSRSSWTRQGYLVSVLCFRKGMACLNMATGISQAVLLIQPSPSGVFSIELHQWHSWMSPVAKLTGKALE